MNFPKFNSGNKSNPSSTGDAQSVKTRLADKIGDMKAKVEINASKDMLAVARDSQARPGSALNAQKAEKGQEGAGTYKYKTDALIKMLDGLVGKFDPALAKGGSDGVKRRTTDIMYRIRESGLNGDNFALGLAQGVRQVMAGYEADPRLKQTGGKVDAAFGGKELKIIEEVLTTLATRMSPSDADKYGLKKTRPSDRNGMDRSSNSRAHAAANISQRDAQEIEDARKSRKYHAKVGTAVKHMGGALQETGRKTGAALRTYSEPLRRDVALGGLKTAKNAAAAAEATVEAAKDLGHHLDHAQAHVVGGAIGIVAGTGQAAGKATVGLGKGAWNTLKKFGSGAKKAAMHGVDAGKDRHAARVDKAKARKAAAKGTAKKAPSDASRSTAPAAASQQQNSVPARPTLHRTVAQAQVPQRPTLTRSDSNESNTSSRSSSSSRSTSSFRTSNTSASSPDEDEQKK